MRSRNDEEHYRKYNCCDVCAITWAYKNHDKWSDGWRPSRDEVIAHVKQRVQSMVKIVID